MVFLFHRCYSCICFQWICQAKVVTEVMEETWKYLTQMRDHIVTLLDDDNDG